MTKKTLTIASVLLLLASVALAQDYLLPWNSINGGGLPGSSTSYGLNSSLAQPVQGFGVATPDYMGYWGFWYGVGRVFNHDVGVKRITVPTDSFPKGTVLTPTESVAEYGDAHSDTAKAFFKILDRNLTQVYFDSTPIIVLDSGTTRVASFPHTWSYADSGHFLAVSYTVDIYDASHANDTAKKPFFVRPTPPETGWVRKADVPPGGKGKNVKDGGALAYYSATDDSSFVYAFKGNGRAEFYRFNIATNVWVAKESIPAVGRAGKKKFVKKGAVLATAGGKVYGAKGGNTGEWWQYTPGTVGVWAQKTDIPMGAKNLKEGGGAGTVMAGTTNYVFLLKGSGTNDWYRYNTLTNVWDLKAPAPPGASGKPFKDGSCVAASEDGKRIFAAKGNYNEFYAYSVDSDKWTTLAPVPLVGRSGKKTKMKSGAGMAYHNRAVYLTKGNNTLEFWKYAADSARWVQMPDYLIGNGKKQKGGGSLAYASGPNALYSLKGNNTLEYYRYGLSVDLDLSSSPASNTDASGITALRNLTLNVSPNPFVHATRVAYSLPRAGNVSLKVYDVTGQLVTTLAEGHSAAGKFTTQVDGSRLASGVYLLKLATDDATTTTKLIIE